MSQITSCEAGEASAFGADGSACTNVFVARMAMAVSLARKAPPRALLFLIVRCELDQNADPERRESSLRRRATTRSYANSVRAAPPLHYLRDLRSLGRVRNCPVARSRPLVRWPGWM